MVRQLHEIADVPSAGSVMSPQRRQPRTSVYGADQFETHILGVRRTVLLILFMVSLFIPAVIQVAGLRLAPYTIFMLVMIGPAFYRIITDPKNRVTAVDVFLTAYVLWCGVVIYHHYGPSRAVFIVNQTVTMLGGYIITRALVRSAEDYRLFFRCFFWGLAFYLPFALLELVTKQMWMNNILGHVFDVPSRAGQGPRLGLWRVQAFLPHSILFGLFCSIGISNLYYLNNGATFRRATGTGLAAFMTALSLSSAPTIAMGLQFIMILWDRFTRLIPGRWVVLLVASVIFIVVAELAFEHGVLGLVIQNLAFNENTGWGRTEILQYSSAEVARHPFFGIGLSSDWVRPYWRKPSVDNFWLLTAMRYGLPALLCLWIGLGIHAFRLMTLPMPNEDEAQIRTGHLIAWVGAFFVLWTVHIWDAAAVFIMAYAGAGAWLYTRETLLPENEPRRSRTYPRRDRQSDGAPDSALPYTRARVRDGQVVRRTALAPSQYTRGKIRSDRSHD